MSGGSQDERDKDWMDAVQQAHNLAYHWHVRARRAQAVAKALARESTFWLALLFFVTLCWIYREVTR